MHSGRIAKVEPFRKLILVLALVWLGFTLAIIPDMTRATASAAHARLKAIGQAIERTKSPMLWH